MRLIRTFTSPNTTRLAKVYKDTENSDYIVKFYVNGVYQSKADYFAGGDDDDYKADAFGTAALFTQQDA